MKLLTTLALIAFAFTTFAQQSEALIPKDAVSVFSINNVNVFQKISLDELVKYDFMEEVQQELFDGSTSGRTLNDSGVDFEQRMSFFQGKGERFNVSGFTLGISDRQRFFEAFDDYTPMESNYDGVDFYESYFNRIAIRGNSAVIFRVEPSYWDIEEVTDSIWYARGNDYPWDNDYYYNWEEEDGSDLEEEIDGIIYELDTEEFDEYESEENTNNPEESDYEIEAEEDPNSKTYWELRDSVETALQLECLKRMCDDLFLQNDNLLNADPRFAEQMSHESDGIFYMDNARNIHQQSDDDFVRMIFPVFTQNVDELYAESIVLGDMNIQDQSIEMDLNLGYGEALGKIYNEMTDAKFDKSVLKYIPEDNAGFFTYTMNMRKAYETTYDYLIPMLTASEEQVALSAITFELIDELINKDAVFDLYQGNVFGTYNGVQMVKTKKIIFEYDEENFDYTEREVEAEEEMPIFTFGFTTKRSDIPERILERISRIYPQLENKGDYWEFENKVMNTAPLFFILQNGLFIVTNNADLARNNAKGYGSKSVSKKLAKQAKKSGIVYAHVNTDRAIEDLPARMFNDYENELLDVLRGKSGELVLTSGESTRRSSSYKLAYNFDGQEDSSGTYILDLINSLYIISK